MSRISTRIILQNVLPLIMGNNEPVTENNDRIIFKFSNVFKTVMLVCTIISVVISLFMFFLAFFTDRNNALLALIIPVLVGVLPSLFLYLTAINKKIIYEINYLYVYNFIGKQKIFNIHDIKEAIEIQSDGMKLIFQDNRKVKVDMQMTNYVKIKDILTQNNIVYKDKYGNNAPKGW